MSDILADIADVVSELADGRQHTERIRRWDRNRNEQWDTHITIQPGLLAQLYESVIPGSADAEGSRPHPTSRPPLAIEALSLYGVIQIAVFRWAHSLRLEQRDTTESMLRALVGAAPQLDDDTAKALLSELRAWRRWCAVMTGWESALYSPRVPCPVCERMGTLRINLTAKSAFCRGGWDPGQPKRTGDAALYDCDGWWDESTIGVLAEWIRAATDQEAA